MERHAKRWMSGLLIGLLLTRVSLAAEEGYVDFRFDNVDVRTFVRVMGEITGKRFIVDEGVKGQVTIDAPHIPVAEAYPLAVTILESVGCTAVEGESAIRIVPFPPGSAPVGAVQGPDHALGGTGFLTRVIALKHVSAAEVKAMLAEVLGNDKRSALAALPTANLIVISGTADLVNRVQTMVEAIDKPGLARVTEVFPLIHASAEDLARQINEAMAVVETEADRIRQQVASTSRGAAGIKAVASPQANSLILVGPPTALAEMKELIAKLDVDPPSGRGRLRAIFLKYLTADDAAKCLKALLSGPAQPAGSKTPVPLGTIGIESSPANNALLVDASPRDFEVVEKLIQELDVMPGQVMIEVLIAEVSLSSGTDIGVQLASLGLPGAVGETTLQGVSTLNDNNAALMAAVEKGLFPKGLTVGVAHGTRVAADGTLLNTFPALININADKKDGRVKILSNIPLLAQNNQDASVSVVNNIPVLKSTVEGGTGSTRDVIKNIERMDVGIKLKLTPHINPDDEVRMLLNPSIEAVIDPGPLDTPFTPTIAKREVSTTVTVRDGEIIVLSGLIREDSTKVIHKIPFLGDIPFLGFLFRHTVDQLERTNLLIFVRPRLVKKGQEAAMTADLEKRSGISSTNQPSRIPPEEANR
jgi:general secretion pathway protein D